MDLAGVETDGLFMVNGRVGYITSHASATREPHSYRAVVQALRAATSLVAVACEGMSAIDTFLWAHDLIA